MYCWVMCTVTSSVLVLFQQRSLPTMKGTCHNHASLCDYCTTACHSVEDRHKYCCIIQVQYQWMFILDWSTCSVMTVWSVFKDGRSSTGDLALPDHPPHSTDPDTQATVDQLVKCSCYIMLWHISEHIGISLQHASHRIIMHVLGYWKVSAVWMLNNLNDEQMATQLGICLEHLLWYERQEDLFLGHIVKGYKS